MGISRIEASISRLGNDSVYGNGADGTVVIATNTYLSRDMYYKNLTISSGVHLNTNGFKVFVSGTLVLNGSIGMKSTDTNNNDGSSRITTKTLAGQTDTATSVSTGIGGSAYGASYTVSQMPQSVFDYVENAVLGAYVKPSGISTIGGGAGGGAGASGSATPQTPAGSGGAGDLNRNPLAPGGPGTAGTVGPSAPLASGGSGGFGGGIVVIAAKSISGSGSIYSNGKNSTTGGPSASGSPGSAGTTAPNQAVAHYTDGSAHYITGDGTHGPHATTPTPNVPHGGHVPHTSTALHHDRYVYHTVYHNDSCPSPQHYAYGHYHGYSPHHNPANENTATYHAINSIPHNHSHRNHSGIAFSGYASDQHVDSNPAHTGHGGAGHGHMHCSNSKGHFTAALLTHHKVGYGNHYVYRNAGTISSVGHVTKYGGSGGSAGIGAGTTAGANGQSGGGGGIVIVSDSSLSGSISTSVSGGSLSGNSGSDGSIIVVVNQ